MILYYDAIGQEKDYFPVPVYAHIRPDMGHNFILGIILSLSRFETELDLKIYRIIHDALHYDKLIGTDDDEKSLNQYSRSLH